MNHFALPCQVSPHSKADRVSQRLPCCTYTPSQAAQYGVSPLLTNTPLHLHLLSPCVSVVPASCVTRTWLPVDSVCRSTAAGGMAILRESKTRRTWPLADLDRDRASAIVVVLVMLESIIVVWTVLVERSVSR
jgi:hypothetical protein